ncbi:MarR family winged helix-turn-helix transcriptional regulator [Ilumatobacter sp.]|uniref:MarR family winged helix-turn-helix transcriptional regulator n=1 Tax=Ilumatobacter sp. TaxID=1967498 RepID=UPI003C3F1D3A
MTEPGDAPLTEGDYRSLAEFRHALRRFLAFSERAARDHGLTPAQHQLLLAVRGHPGPTNPSMSELAELLQLRLHSVGELADRAVDNGLVTRDVDPDDGRRSLLVLTAEGTARLDALSLIHRRELRRFRAELGSLLDELGDEHDPGV